MSEHPDAMHRWERRSRNTRTVKEKDPSPTPTLKPPAPIILGLVRPSASQISEQTTTTTDMSTSVSSGLGEGAYGGAAVQGNVCQHQRPSDKPIVVLKSREDNRTASVSPVPAAVALPGDPTHPPYSPSHAPYSSQSQRHGSVSQQSLEANKTNRLAPPPEMKHSVKLIDDTFRWVDTGIEELVEQSDYLVVGALGLQGTGKSTILSLLGGNTPQDAYRNYIFQPQTKETREDGSHQTVGVDMFVTPERIILLDTQPVLSPSLLDNMIRHDKKYPTEFTTMENCVEMQSLQIASFLMTVCHVIIVSQDWFTDLTFLHFLLTSEMLKPQTPSGGHESSGNQEEIPDFFPTVVFLMNKAGQDDFTPETYANMQMTLHQIFHTSKLKYRGGVTMNKDGIISGLKASAAGMTTDVNLFLLPLMEYYKTEPESILAFLPEYRGYPSFSSLLRSLRNQIYSIPRQLMTPSPLSERNWFHFAARMWEAVKKSQLFAEYNRLLP